MIKTQVNVHLPDAANIPTQTKPENIVIAVTAPGDIYWNNKKVASSQELIDKIKEKAVVVPQPEIHIRADRDALFQSVGRVLYSIQRGGIVRWDSSPSRTPWPWRRALPTRTASSNAVTPKENPRPCQCQLAKVAAKRCATSTPRRDRRDAGAAHHADSHAARHEPRGEAGHAQPEQHQSAAAGATGGA